MTIAVDLGCKATKTNEKKHQFEAKSVLCPELHDATFTILCEKNTALLK